MAKRLLRAGALALAAALAMPAVAATYQYRVYIPGMTGLAQLTQAAQAIVVALTGGSLPAATVTKSYAYDLNALLSVTGDSAYNASNVVWSVSAGALPAGLTLTNGVVAGVPTVKNLTGNSFEVLATYKTKSGQQVYTIVVNGNVLKVTALAAGVYNTCGITLAGGLKCWGDNTYGQLGNGTALASLKPTDVSGLTSGVASVAVGIYHICAVTTGGAAKCWGINDRGQLGINNAGVTNSATPLAVSGLSAGVTQLATAYDHVCAVVGGAAKCWGGNTYGPVGDGTTTDRFAPVTVSGLSSGVASVSTGGDHSCAKTTGGAVKCWGWNVGGELGNGTKTASSIPVNVTGLSSGVASISAGYHHTCALTTGGGAKCWGLNSNGALGNTTLTDATTPVNVNGLTAGVSSVVAGGYHSCALVSGAAYCWGYNGAGQVGDGTQTDRTSPVQVSGLGAGVSALAGGYYHQCAIGPEGATCWGYGPDGQLGNGGSANSAVQTDVLAD